MVVTIFCHTWCNDVTQYFWNNIWFADVTLFCF